MNTWNRIFYNIINVTWDQFIASILNKIIEWHKKMTYWPYSFELIQSSNIKLVLSILDKKCTIMLDNYDMIITLFIIYELT